MTKRIIGTVAGVAIFATGMFAMLGPASAVETSGTVYQCANRYTGALRLAKTDVNGDPLCSYSETPYEIEGELWVPTPTPTP